MVDYEELSNKVESISEELQREIDYNALEKQGIIKKSKKKGRWYILDWARLPRDVIKKISDVTDQSSGEVKFINPKTVRKIISK
ncbi:hypothetical protein IG626_01990 [Desulfovibrio desulfuricans]|uniref:hypothetical protein n=1 Tax=Desulfovibrio desulfuricans TaxID=876 RepID=UPI0017826526|nr:hypothetical protein [Desulfovibrio desulfuricans]MBD8894760.1 hypothetical protein [Desulfovibrio desulfuricans]